MNTDYITWEEQETDTVCVRYRRIVGQRKQGLIFRLSKEGFEILESDPGASPMLRLLMLAPEAAIYLVDSYLSAHPDHYVVPELAFFPSGNPQMIITWLASSEESNISYQRTWISQNLKQR